VSKTRSFPPQNPSSPHPPQHLHTLVPSTLPTDRLHSMNSACLPKYDDLQSRRNFFWLSLLLLFSFFISSRTRGLYIAMFLVISLGLPFSERGEMCVSYLSLVSFGAARVWNLGVPFSFEWFPRSLILFRTASESVRLPLRFLCGVSGRLPLLSLLMRDSRVFAQPSLGSVDCWG